MITWHKAFCQLHFESLGGKKRKRENRLLLTQAGKPEAQDGNIWLDEPENLKSPGPWPLQAARLIHLPPDEGEAFLGLESMQRPSETGASPDDSCFPHHLYP